MSASDHRAPIAVLGPTNTGKTHLAIERMCAHSSGMIGFPLRLLAREVYDRVAAIKGKDQVALITGEERIAPPGARWLLCTAESMPLDRDVAFVALDEAQLGADPERGHVFTERILHARGRDETMLLGSDALRPILRTLVPQAEIISRPRFSTLTHAGAVKLSRLPPRSAIVAFSAEEVYAVAEMLRRMRGGAAVVMGSLSPQTRNAQVAMFQAGEVDYLVATDAVGMGLNMDVAHVAFASLRKFDGRRQRRLTIAEMAQIAGRAGRHQRDGTFGTLAHDGGARAVLEEDEIAAIEQHRFPPLDHLRWREGRPRLGSIDALIEDLERKPDRAGLRAAPQTIDLAVLKRLAEEPWVRERARGSAMVGRLWAACGLPDFRKTGAEAHARLVGRLFRHLSEGTGRMPVPWFAEEVARLESVQGDVETLADRIAGIRTWSYIAHRADWLADPETWAERTRQIETRLSDALHQRLTQRFVDRRTSVLMRDLGARGIDALPVRIAEDGEVSVGGEPIGRLDGFRFTVDPDARLQDKKRLLAAAERRLGGEYARRARRLADAGDEAFRLDAAPGGKAQLFWETEPVAQLERGRDPLSPKVQLQRGLDPLSSQDARAVQARLETWLDSQIERRLAALVHLRRDAASPEVPAQRRALSAQLADALGIAARERLDTVASTLDHACRRAAHKRGVRFGTLDIFLPALLKPEAMLWRAALAATYAGASMPAPPPPGAVTLPTPADTEHRTALGAFGYRIFGGQMLRIDMVERIARKLHEERAKARNFAPDMTLARSMGLQPDSFHRLLADLGFRRAGEGWIWRGRPRRTASTQPSIDNRAFAALAILKEARG